jgi:hypothetical protein
MKWVNLTTGKPLHFGLCTEEITPLPDATNHELIDLTTAPNALLLGVKDRLDPPGGRFAVSCLLHQVPPGGHPKETTSVWIGVLPLLK